MPTAPSRYFGSLEYSDESAIVFPQGIPGFEEEKRFVFIEQVRTRPLVFMQSLARPDLCFPALPVQLVEPGYRLQMSVEDRQILELPREQQPEIGAQVLCLVLVSLAKGQPPTGNLLAPVVVNLKTRKAMQSIQMDSGYSYRHELLAGTRESTCC